MKQTEMEPESVKDQIVHLPRRIDATMSTCQMLSSAMAKKKDFWCAFGVPIWKISNKSIESETKEVETLYIHLSSFADIMSPQIIHQLTFRGVGSNKVHKVQPIGEHSNYETRFLNSFPVNVIDEHTTQWTPSKTGGTTAHDFRITFREKVDVSHLCIEMVGFTPWEGWDQIHNEKHGLLLITSDGLEMKSPLM